MKEFKCIKCGGTYYEDMLSDEWNEDNQLVCLGCANEIKEEVHCYNNYRLGKDD